MTTANYIYTPKVYTILISRDLKNQKVGIHPPPTPKKRRRGWTPGRLGTYGSRTDSLTFKMKLHLFSLFSFPFQFPFLSFFWISVFWFSCLGSPQASRHALGPAALGYGGVPSFNLNNIKTNPRKKIPLTLLCWKITRAKKKVQQNIELAVKCI